MERCKFGLRTHWPAYPAFSWVPWQLYQVYEVRCVSETAAAVFASIKLMVAGVPAVRTKRGVSCQPLALRCGPLLLSTVCSFYMTWMRVAGRIEMGTHPTARKACTHSTYGKEYM